MEELGQEQVAGGSALDRAISLLSEVFFTTPVEISTHSVMLNTDLTLLCGHAVKGQDPLQSEEESRERAEDRERNHIKTIRQKLCHL